jgi:excisionase family DNA binding protein
MLLKCNLPDCSSARKGLQRRQTGDVYAVGVDVETLEGLIGEWLPLPDVAELLGTDVGKVRRMIAEGRLIAVRLGERKVLGVPASFLRRDGDTWTILPSLPGTLTVLRDSGFSDEEAVGWLFTPDDSLSFLGSQIRTPIDALVSGAKTEIRRRAAALAF